MTIELFDFEKRSIKKYTTEGKWTIPDSKLKVFRLHSQATINRARYIKVDGHYYTIKGVGWENGPIRGPATTFEVDYDIIQDIEGLSTVL